MSSEKHILVRETDFHSKQLSFEKLYRSTLNRHIIITLGKLCNVQIAEHLHDKKNFITEI